MAFTKEIPRYPKEQQRLEALSPQAIGALSAIAYYIDRLYFELPSTIDEIQVVTSPAGRITRPGMNNAVRRQMSRRPVLDIERARRVAEPTYRKRLNRLSIQGVLVVDPISLSSPEYLRQLESAHSVMRAIRSPWILRRFMHHKDVRIRTVVVHTDLVAVGLMGPVVHHSLNPSQSVQGFRNDIQRSVLGSHESDQFLYTNYHGFLDALVFHRPHGVFRDDEGHIVGVDLPYIVEPLAEQRQFASKNGQILWTNDRQAFNEQWKGAVPALFHALLDGKPTTRMVRGLNHGEDSIYRY